MVPSIYSVGPKILKQNRREFLHIFWPIITHIKFNIQLFTFLQKSCYIHLQNIQSLHLIIISTYVRCFHTNVILLLLFDVIKTLYQIQTLCLHLTSFPRLLLALQNSIMVLHHCRGTLPNGLQTKRMQLYH